MNLKTPGFDVGQKYNLEFQISKEAIECFSILTGDASSLHVNEKFGRKSIYRTNVVHGMLTVAHICSLELFCTDNLRFSFQKISANFLKPVFADELLSLEAEIKEQKSEEHKLKIEYRIKKAGSDVLVVTGFVTVHYSNAHEGNGSGLTSVAQIQMLQVALTENDFKFDQIEKNQKAEFPFRISRDCAYALGKALSTNTTGIQPNLLGSFLFSTFAGMCIPGRSATIINLQVEFNKEIEWDRLYDFIGTVGFKSSAKSIVQNIIIKDSQEEIVYAQGKMNVQINAPSVVMPSIKLLRENAMDLQLKDKVVLITGASRGIGETTAKLFALHGAKVAVNYFKGEEDAERVVKEIKDSGQGKAIAVCADVSNEEQVNEMIKIISTKLGAIDVLVNNAVGSAVESNFMALSWDEIQKDIDIIVKGAFNCCKAVIPSMEQRGGGKIINLSTIYTENPPPHQFKYVVAKSALVGLTRSLAVDLAPKNIQVNMVVPSMIETDLTAGVNKMVSNGIIHNTPMKRLASPVDVARSIIFLASSLNSFTTGQKIMVTGGNAPFL